MATTLNDLVKNLTLLDSADAVRRKVKSYTRNTEGGIIALSLSESEIESLILDKDAAALEHLYLSGNEALKQIDIQIPLPHLKHLYLDGCALEELTIPKGCDNLEQIYVQKNKLTKLVFEGDCPALILLDTSNNQLKTFQLSYDFGQLKYLYLNNNQLENIDFSHHLYCLNTLNLVGNKLKELPNGLSNLTSMETLYLKGNDLTAIDREFWDTDTNSWERVKPYLFSLEKIGSKKVQLREAKMILIGNGEVGKTSIRLRLIDEKAKLPDKKDRTPGLEVEPYFIKNLSPQMHSSESIDFKLNIWDFGGQGKYREVQHLFCSRKSLYIYVTSPDDKPEYNQAYVGYEYWLSMVNAFIQNDESDAKDSPIIYVQNKSDLFKKDDKFINEKDIIDKGFVNIHDFINISSDKLTNFSEFRQLINEAISKISSDVFTAEYSEEWITVKQELESQKNKNHIKRSDFDEICSDNGLTNEEAETWLHILDRIGTVIYFGNNEKLKDWVILNPIWVKDAICKVLDFEFYTETATLVPEFLTKIWKDYSNDEQNKLKQLLLAYNFCYEENGKYIVPALFNEEKPELPEHLDTFDYQIELRYKPYLPAGTLHKFMVVLNKKIYNDLRWKTGVILQDAIHNTYAEITEDWKKHILTIRLKGTEQNLDPLWILIRDTFQKLNHDLKETKFIKSLDFETYCWHDEAWETVSKMMKLHEKHNVNSFTFMFDSFKKIKELKKEKIMSIEVFQNQVRNLVGQAKTEDAIKVIESWANNNEVKEAQNAIALIKADWLKLKREENLGMADNPEKRRATINFRILNFEWTSSSTGLPPIESKDDKNETSHDSKKSTIDICKMLFLGSNPLKLKNLQIQKEYFEISERLKKEKQDDKFDMDNRMFTRKRDFMDAIIDFKPNIIHFAGHGKASDEATSELSRAIGIVDWAEDGGLIFHDRDYQEIELVNTEDLEGFFENFVVNRKIPIEVVVLNACYSSTQAQAISKHVKYVIGMRNTILDDDGIEFSYAFYGSIARGETPLQAYNDGKSLVGASKARKLLTIFIDGKEM